ncbi:MAG: hypothetical protein WCP31_02525 [Chloroflexales bacterium]
MIYKIEICLTADEYKAVGRECARRYDLWAKTIREPELSLPLEGQLIVLLRKAIKGLQAEQRSRDALARYRAGTQRTTENAPNGGESNDSH